MKFQFKEETAQKQSAYEKLCNHLRISQSFKGKDHKEASTSLETKWQKVKAQVTQLCRKIEIRLICCVGFPQVRHWQWLLDTALPGEFGQVGEWLNRGEALIYADDIPTELNEEVFQKIFAYTLGQGLCFIPFLLTGGTDSQPKN